MFCSPSRSLSGRSDVQTALRLWRPNILRNIARKSAVFGILCIYIKYLRLSGAGCRNRTRDLLITNLEVIHLPIFLCIHVIRQIANKNAFFGHFDFPGIDTYSLTVLTIRLP